MRRIDACPQGGLFPGEVKSGGNKSAEIDLADCFLLKFFPYFSSLFFCPYFPASPLSPSEKAMAFQRRF